MKDAFGVEELSQITPVMIRHYFKEGVILRRSTYRKELFYPKIRPHDIEYKVETKKEDTSNSNQLVGFRALKYSVMENAGSIIISVVKKEIRGKFTVGIRTKGGTATPDEDFQAID